MIFNRLLALVGCFDSVKVLDSYSQACRKKVGDRQTHSQTHRQTDRRRRLLYSCPPEREGATIITLKRFESNEHGVHKIKTHVQVPVEAWRPMDGGPTYKPAIATVDHRGVSLASGHYVANCLRDTWYLLDDTRAQTKFPALVTCRDIYILFYHRS